MSKALQLFCLMLFIFNQPLFAQIASSNDTVRVIQIIRGKNLREITVDSVTKIETIAGNVLIQEGSTKFTCDSAILNKRLNTLEAFGNVRINQGDTLFTNSQYLKYL